MSVPMDPQYFPEAGLMLASVIAGAVALRLLLRRQLRRALLAGATSAACILLTIVLARTTHPPPKPPGLLPASSSSMSLVLGDVHLLVVPSDRYALSVEGKRFLELDRDPSDLKVSCVVGVKGRTATRIDDNTISSSRVGLRLAGDGHSLRLHEDAEEVFRVVYAEPWRIEVEGEFAECVSRESVRCESKPNEPILVSLKEGIRWNGSAVPARTTIDLRSQGKGPIDFGPSGSIRVVPSVPPRSEDQGKSPSLASTE